MSYSLLAGKRGIIFGALNSDSIAWKVAQRCLAEGAVFTLTNAPLAMRMGEIHKLAADCGAEVIPADATSLEDLENLMQRSMEVLGGKLDFVLHSIGMSPNVRKGRHYTDLNYDFFLKTIDVSALSFHKTLQTAMRLDALNEWSSVVGLTYIAAQRTFPDYSDMAEAKSVLESIARSFGFHYGFKRKVRVNTISQSPTPTTAGQGVHGFDAFIKFAGEMSPLGNADAVACADYCVAMFSDLTRYVTMQNLYHDGGFSSTGVTAKVLGMEE
ncbi:MAG: SDR family oxidoreductase [Flavobacteriales bacterium]|nr:SDR family oxidoreductase [Flavobacteriales bacterium]